MNVRRDEAGLVGKMVVVWLLFLGVIAVAAIDAASIAFTTYKLSDVGSAAATEGARVFRADPRRPRDAATGSRESWPPRNRRRGSPTAAAAWNARRDA